MIHLRHFGYLIRHKLFVFVAGVRLGVPIWRLLIHDWSKFTPTEWNPYSRRHSGFPIGEEMARAIAHHHRWNPHHWEHWNGRQMPPHFAREMVADWVGAERANHGSWEIRSWYVERQHAMTMHPTTRALVESLLGKTD